MMKEIVGELFDFLKCNGYNVRVMAESFQNFIEKYGGTKFWGESTFEW